LFDCSVDWSIVIIHIDSKTTIGIHSTYSSYHLPIINGTVHNVKQLNDNVKIYREQNGIAHIYAMNVNDALFAQGYLISSERMFQLELMRRIATGRMSELVGSSLLYADRVSRTFGFGRLGVLDVQNAKKSEQGQTQLHTIQSYVDGVNYYLNSTEYKKPFEFVLLGLHTIEPFTVEHIGAITRLVGWQMARGWLYKVINLHVHQTLSSLLKLGASDMETIYSTLFDLYNYPKDFIPTHLPTGDIEINMHNLDELVESSPPTDQGSNAWAVSGNYTKSGKPLLASDPHLAVSHPGTWFQMHIEVPGVLNFTGCAMIGLPFIQIGHSEKISIGITLSYADTADVYLEKTTDNLEKYEFKGEWRNTVLVPEVIHVKGAKEPHTEIVRYTNHGAILSDILHINPSSRLQNERKVFSIKAAFLDPDVQLPNFPPYMFLQLVQAANWNEYYEFSKQIRLLSLNIVYADAAGNIGYTMVGAIPDRSKYIHELKSYERGLPVTGWTGEYEWNGYIPAEENPVTLNPKQGFIISANHKIYGDNYKHYLGSSFLYGIRAMRLKQLMEQFISKHGFVTLEDCKAMQMDITEPEEHISMIIDISNKLLQSNLKELSNQINLHGIAEEHIRSTLTELSHFHGHMSPDRIDASIYVVFTDRLFDQILRKLLIDNDHVISMLRGSGFDRLIYKVSEYQHHDIRMIYTLTQSTLETLNEKTQLLLTYQAIVDTILKIRELIHIDTTPLPVDTASIQQELQLYTYGKFHILLFEHAMGQKIPAYNRGPYSIGGSSYTPNLQSPVKDGKSYKVQTYPSFRMVVDWSDLENSQAIFAPGQSGHLASPHYDDNIHDFIHGNYRKMFFSRQKVESESVAVLELTPQQT
jgi:penicillin amidase